MLSVKNVAERLGVSPQCIYNLVERGLLECHRIGVGRGTIRVSEEQLTAYLEAAKRGPPRRDLHAAAAPDKASAGGFTVLDGQRLKEAWKNR